MKVTPSRLPGILVIEPDVFEDSRGKFVVTHKAPEYAAAGINVNFVQDNFSGSKRGVVRGLHLQHPVGQAKLVFVTFGEVFDVCVDVRVGSPTFGHWVSEILSAENAKQLFIPVGYAHGFCVLSDEAHFVYKCSELYRADSQVSIAWNDPALAISWPVGEPIMSPKDQEALPLSQMHAHLPRYQGD